MLGGGERLPLKGKAALVCGASRGIGRACAREIARLGARVTLLSRNEELLKRTLGEIPAEGGPEGAPPLHDYLVADFDDPSAVGGAVARYLEQGGTFNILLNNAGGPPGGALLDAEPPAFLRAFSNHILCSQILTQILVPGMKVAGYGRVINIVSTSIRQPIPGLGVSNAVRAAMAAWAKTLSRELAPFGITVNNVLPGATRTDRLLQIIRDRARAAGKPEQEIEEEMKREIPAGRFAEPEEIAAAAGFLALPVAGYVNGISLAVDGGRTSAL
jgi:3-oxoacyl-[acyl-carrier protein] reductase